MSEHFNRMAQHLDQISRKHDKNTLFADFLTVALCCYHTVNIKSRLQEKDPDNEERYATVINKYDQEDQNTLPKILAEYQLHLRVNPYTDPLGEYYQQNIPNGKMGQYFTPNPICNLMTQLQGKETKENQTVYDPACGSGRTLLNFAKDHPKNLFVGNDLHPSCAKMAVLNMFFHNLSAEINWMDSISGKWFGGWHINMDKFGIQPIEKEQSIEWNNAQHWKSKTPEPPPIILDYRTNIKQEQPPTEQMSLFDP